PSSSRRRGSSWLASGATRTPRSSSSCSSPSTRTASSATSPSSSSTSSSRARRRRPDRPPSPCEHARMTYEHELLDVDVTDGVAVVTIDAPPINVMTIALYIQLATVCAELEADDDVRVVVLRSADPDFFIAHFDVAAILQFPTDGPAVRDEHLSAFHEMCERLRTMPKATIAEIAGRVGGGGS